MRNLYFNLFAFLISVQTLSAQEAPIHTWANKMGGTGSDAGTDIKTDISGNVYTIGYFIGTSDFDPGASVSNLTSAGLNDIFISKLDVDGNFVWAKSIGGTGDDHASSLFVDATGNFYLTGSFSATVDFDPGASVLSFTAAGQTDIFISKFDTNGNLLWAKRIGGSSVDVGTSIVMGSSGNLYFTGNYSGTVDFNPDAPVVNLVASGFNIGFISKFDSNGNFIWVKDFTGSSYSGPTALTTDNSENIISTGNFSGSNDFDPGAGTFSMTAVGIFGNSDIFVSRLDKDGNFIWAKQMGGTGQDYSVSIVADATGNVYTTGNFFTISDFDPGAATFSFDAGNSGFGDIFVSKLDSNGDFVWAKQMGGQGSDSDDRGLDLTLDNSGNLLITGKFNTSGDFDPGPGVFNLSTAGADGGDVFISKLDASGNFIWATRVGGSVSNGEDRGNAITINQLGSIYLTGFFSTTADFDVNACTFNLTVAGSRDIFVHKLNIGTSLIPTFSSFAPTFGPVGTTVTLTGTNFSTTLANNEVRFNGTLATVSSSTPTTITTTVPTGATTGKINITVNCTTVTRVQDFIVTSIALPNISSFTPTSGPIGTAVTITGTNFSTTPANNTVQFNGTTAVVTASTATSITCTVPTGATTGAISVTVAGNTATSSSDFTVTSGSDVVPGVEWFKGIITAQDVEIRSMTTDAAGNIYTTGQFDGTVDFDPNTGVFNLTSAGNGDIFVSKITSDGNLVWAFRLGDTGNNDAQQIAVDAIGNIYLIAGVFSSKYDTNGNLIGAVPSFNTTAIGIDGANDLYMAGSFTGTVDFDPGASVFNLTSAGSSDIFVLKLSSIGNFIWAKRIGGTQGESIRSIALDASGNLVVAGSFGLTVDFDPNAGTVNLTSAGTTDIFILKLDNAGNYTWARRLGSTASEGADDITTDAASNVLITGVFTGTLDFDPGAAVVNITSVGGLDAFVLKMNSAGNYVWAKSVGGSGQESGNSIITDGAGDVYYTGKYGFATVDFDPGAGVFNITPAGSNEIFVSKLDASGNFLWALGTQPNSTSFAFSPEIYLLPSDKIIVTGSFEDGTIDFDPGTCTTELTTLSVISTFLLKLGPTATCSLTITSFTPSSGQVGTSVTITGTNFSTSPSNNTVMFNGTTAVVTASTATSITTTVPNGATTGTITVTVAGNTAVSATNFTVTAGSVITINPQPISTAVCEGAIASFTLAASGTTNITYQWQKFNGTAFANISNGGGYSGTTTSTLSINTAGNFGAGDYRCSVSGDLATSAFSQTASLTFTTSGTLAEITVDGTTLTASSGDSYQWYQNGDVVLGATDQFFEFNVLEYGLYVVDVTDNGCTSTSDEFEYLITSVENLSNGLKVFPNPVEENLFVEFKPPYMIQVVGVTGNVIQNLSVESTTSSFDFSSMAKGIYFLKIKKENQTQYLRIIKK